MNGSSVEQQLAALRPALGFAAHLHRHLVACALLGAFAAVVFWHPVPPMVAFFLAVVGLAERRAGPSIVAALVACDSGSPADGEVDVSISVRDGDHHYHARVREPGHPDWQYEFVPQGWQPVAATVPARIWRAGDAQAPVLAVVAVGVPIPRYDARPVAAGDGTG